MVLYKYRSTKLKYHEFVVVCIVMSVQHNNANGNK